MPQRHTPRPIAKIAKVILAIAVTFPVLVPTNPVNAQGPTDDIAPSIDSVDIEPNAIGPGDTASVVIEGTFASAQGSDPAVTIDGDSTISVVVLAWDEDQIFGHLTSTSETPRGLKTLKVSQELASGTPSEATAANAFRIGFVPLISGVSPTTIDVTVTTTITVTGDKFETNAVATLERSGETTITLPTTVASGGASLTADFTADAAMRPGSWTLRVSNPGAGTSATTSLAFEAAAPTVDSMSTVPIGQGGPNVAVVVTGTNFHKGVGVSVTGGGVSVSSLGRVSDTELNFDISATESASPGFRSIVVTNGDGKSATISDAVEVIVKPAIDPVTESELITLPQGVERGEVIVSGTGFRSDTSVTFMRSDGTPIPDMIVERWMVVAGGARLEVTAPENLDPGELIAMRFENLGGGADTCRVSSQAVLEGDDDGCITMTPGPRATEVDPTTVFRDTRTSIEITGDRFFLHSQSGPSFPTVHFSGSGIEVVGPVTYTPTRLTAPIEIDPGADLGLRDVIVANPDGGRGTCDGCLEITDPSS